MTPSCSQIELRRAATMAAGAFRSLGRPGEAKGTGVRVGAASEVGVCGRGKVAHCMPIRSGCKFLIDRQTRRCCWRMGERAQLSRRTDYAPDNSNRVVDSEGDVGAGRPQNTGYPRRIAETRGKQ